MQRRTFERIPVSIQARCYCDNYDYSGTVTNLSEKGMYISVDDMCFPFNCQFQVSFSMGSEMLNIPVNVRRIVKTSDQYDGIGVEVIEPPQLYSEFIGRLRKGT